METITHRRVAVNGVNLHVAEKGEGPVVLLIHGFPELWYSWRHQILSLSSLGFRAVAPDLRGYGDLRRPSLHPRSYSILHIVGDLVALIDSLGQDKVFVVGHDWGATVAWNLCMLRPDRVKALVNMSVVFSPRHPKWKPVDSIRALLGDDHYICMFQEPGQVEAEFARMDIKLLVNSILTYREPAPLTGSKIKGFRESPVEELPPWLTEEDIHYFVSKFDKSGFTGGLNYYRNMNRYLLSS
ncbi:uncharacterized protein A4U43_C07F14830 [Asparagus officinalis]|uniref:AB hydrolase-1 domain-containing protein n=1 Tax=Asparagus officinalis TaxID=4686 RepID=A0A5P1EC22_ASPOF|nr:uncharacterized protein A4U43_C07F14830 [Asparagus officinalis]